MDTKATNNFDIETVKKVFQEVIPFHKYMGFIMEDMKSGYCKLRIPFKDEFIGEFREGRIHGGVLTSAIDSVSGAAAGTMINIMTDRIATLDLRVDYLNPAVKEDIIIEAKVQKSGKRSVFVDANSYHPSDPDKTLAQGRVVFSVKRKENS